jgi:small subunit ribosomal protein S17
MKTMTGTVKSAKSLNAAIVTVTRRWQHPLYKKFVKKMKSYACHVEKGMEVQEGDTVTIAECRPLSKTKHFKVVRKNESTTV